MKKTRILSLLNTIVFLIHVFISYSTQFKLINNKDVGEVSNNYSSLFTPAPLTFAIWGLIYFSLLLFCIYHIIIAWKRSDAEPANQDLLRIGPWFIVNNIATAAWLLAWTAEMLALSVLLIVIQLVSLIIINLRLAVYDGSREIRSKIFTQFPLSIYFAWLTIATIANVSSYLAAMNFSAGISEVTWAVIMISVAVLLTIAVIITRRNVFYGLVVIWALYGILRKQSSNNDSAISGMISNTALAGIALVGVVCVIQVILNSRSTEAHHRKLKQTS